MEEEKMVSIKCPKCLDFCICYENLNEFMSKKLSRSDIKRIRDQIKHNSPAVILAPKNLNDPSEK